MMSTEITTTDGLGELAKFEQDIKPLLDGFMTKLSKDPNKASIKVNKFSGNAKYVPISILESALDSIFQGIWSIKNLKYSIELNSVIVSLELHVFHPITRTWMIRSGIGAVPVELDKVTKQLNSKALHKNVGAAKAFAFRNATISLGRRFGRNLNRDEDFPFTVDSSNFESVLTDKE